MFDTFDSQAKDLAVGDVDKDGDMDIVVVRKLPFSNPGARTNYLLINEDGKLFDRTSNFVPGFNQPDDSRDVALFDANNDGWLDMVICTTFSQQPRLFINQGKGKFHFGWQGFREEKNWFSPKFKPGPKFCAVTAGDVTGDGFDDLFFVDYDNSLEDRLLINDGKGHFTDETLGRMTAQMSLSAFGTKAIIADWNYDGVNDIVKLSTFNGPSVIRLLINDVNNEGNFIAFQDLPFDATCMLEAGDFNNDRRMDIFAVSDVSDYIIFNDSSNSDGTINTTTMNVDSNRTNGFGGNAHAWDINNDGWTDIGVADVDPDVAGCDRQIGLLRNNKGTNLSDPNNDLTLSWNSQGVYDFCWIDINNDGLIDMFQATCHGYKLFVQDR